MADRSTPPQVRKSTLAALSHQVAGHEAGIFTMAGGHLVAKPCLPGEADFYQSAHDKQQQQLESLQRYLPTYHGTIDIIDDDDDDEAKRAVIMENLTQAYTHANVLDIKLGTQLWDESATAEKRARMDKAAATTTSGTHGVRLTGWQMWNAQSGATVKVDKTFGKTIGVEQLAPGLRVFFGIGSEEDARIVSNFAGGLIANVELPAKSMVRLLEESILPALKQVAELTRTLEWRVRGGSVLIVYEGDEAALDAGLNAPFPPSGRASGQEDVIVDTDKLDSLVLDGVPKHRVADVRLIDFAHASFVPGEGHDEGYQKGLDTTVTLLEKLSGDYHAGG